MAAASKRIASPRARDAAAVAAGLLSADPRAALVYLFGSAVDDDQTLVRDVDLGVLTQPPLGADELLRLRADIATALGLPIDLVSLNRAPVVLAQKLEEVISRRILASST